MEAIAEKTPTASGVNKAPRAKTLTERMRPHLAAIAKLSPATEANRMVSAQSIALVREAGFMRAWVPAVLGGDEVDITDYCQAVRELTKACPATGWVTGVLNTHPVTVSHFHPEVRKEVWTNGVDTVICSSGSPQMKAKLVDGGILVSGRGRWASGCDHAEWAMVGVKVPDPTDAQYPERRYRDSMFMVHRSQYKIEDTWYSTGQRGSGSKDLVFENVFVDWRHVQPLDALTFGYAQGTSSIDSWITRVPMPSLISTFLAAVALGCADGMVEQFTNRQRVRKNAYTGAKGILNPAGYMRLAESVQELESLSAYYRQILEEMQEFGMRREKLTETSFMRLQTRIPFVSARAINVLNRLFEAAGASAIADFNVMQRYWRDAHAARLHQGMDFDVALQHFGRNLMGLPPTPDL